MNPKREYRNMELRITKPENEEEKSYKVEGYASTFDLYKLATVDGVDYYEQIDPEAFKDADMSDVVFRVDHEGRVYARTSARDLQVWTDEHGLGNTADLSRTAQARELFEDIEAGHYPQMSFAFIVGEDDYDKKTRTRTIRKVSKVFDVSPVSFPANPNTELGLATRDWLNGVIEAEKAERLEAEEREAQKLKIRILLED